MFFDRPIFTASWNRGIGDREKGRSRRYLIRKAQSYRPIQSQRITREGRYGWVHSGVQLLLLLRPGSRICRSSFPPRTSSSISSVSLRSSSFRARGALRGTFSPRCILVQDHSRSEKTGSISFPGSTFGEHIAPRCNNIPRMYNISARV